MAHTCPSCGAYCTCNGDWDDIDFGEDLGCQHECDDFDDLIPEDEEDPGVCSQGFDKRKD